MHSGYKKDNMSNLWYVQYTYTSKFKFTKTNRHFRAFCKLDTCFFHYAITDVASTQAAKYFYVYNLTFY